MSPSSWVCATCARPLHQEDAAGVLWCLFCGYGRNTREPAPQLYDKQYAKHYHQLADTPLGKRLLRIRLAFASFVDTPFPTIVDWGCGPGALLKAMSQERRGLLYGYDINPACEKYWTPSNGSFKPLDQRSRARSALALNFTTRHTELPNEVDLAIFCDSLEHVIDARAPFTRLNPKHVLVVIPVMESYAWPHSKHFKVSPPEHIHFWSALGFEDFLYNLGYKTVCRTDIETRLGRESVQTFFAERKDQVA